MSTPADQLPPIPATPGLFIPQVPFKQLPFPWDDLTNTPQPDATQYYPDHAPSVVATLAGMHPTNQQGQTLNTDGDHALLVKDINGGSGGGGSPVSVVPYQLVETTSGFGDEEVFDLGAIGSVIYGISLAWSFAGAEGGTANVNATVAAFIPTTSSGGDCYLAALGAKADGTDKYYRLSAECNIWFGNGLIIPSAQNFGSGNYQLWFRSTNVGGGNLSLCVWCSA